MRFVLSKTAREYADADRAWAVWNAWVARDQPVRVEAACFWTLRLRVSMSGSRLQVHTIQIMLDGQPSDLGTLASGTMKLSMHLQFRSSE